MTKRELSTRYLAAIALIFAIASAIFSWQWAVRYRFLQERYECQIMRVESKMEVLEHQLLNIGGLFLKTSEEAPRTARPAPSDPRFTFGCDRGATFTLLRRLEAGRANQFLIWYYLNMRKLHFQGNEQRRGTHP